MKKNFKELIIFLLSDQHTSEMPFAQSWLQVIIVIVWIHQYGYELHKSKNKILLSGRTGKLQLAIWQTIFESAKKASDLIPFILWLRRSGLHVLQAKNMLIQMWLQFILIIKIIVNNIQRWAYWKLVIWSKVNHYKLDFCKLASKLGNISIVYIFFYGYRMLDVCTVHNYYFIHT